MGQPTTSLVSLHLQQLRSEAPFVWLFEIDVPDGSSFRLTNNTEPVTWGAQSDGTPIVYDSAAIAHGTISALGDGSIPTLPVTVGLNLSISNMIDQHDGLEGEEMRVILISSEDGVEAQPALEFKGDIVSARMNATQITAEVSAFSVFEEQFPPFVFTKVRCGVPQFGDHFCGYNWLAPGAAYTFCPRTFQACIDRGDDEVARSLPRNHPKRMRVFPSIGAFRG